MMLPIGPFSFDLSISHAIQGYQPAWLTLIAKIITTISQPEFIVPVFLIVAGWLYVRKQSTRDLTLILIMLGNTLTLIIKAFVHRPRPDPTLIHVLVHETATSFPSGHALAALLTAASIWVIFRTKKSLLIHIALAIYVIAVGWSRLYLGVHWFSDVVAGYVIGVLWVALSLFLIKRTTKNTSKK